jgi:beta-lactamase regulating signal transducer with metallopeptidase domain
MNALIDFFLHDAANSGVAAWFLDAALKSFVVFAVAGVVCLGLRRASAASRHLVWFLAVVSLLVMPLISPMLPSWNRAVWSVAVNQSSANEMSLMLVLAPARDVALPPLETPGGPAAFESLTAIGTDPRKPRGLATEFRAGWLGVVMGVWLTGVLVVLSSMAIGRLWLRCLRRRTHGLHGAGWAELLEELRVTLKIRRPVLLVQLSNRVMPATWGSWRPIILLPAEADHWPLDRRRMVLLHELAHVKRWDCLTQTIARIAGALYWFNPLVWLAARRMCVERERACDDLALRGGWKASEYATHLVDIAQSLRAARLGGAVAMARSSHLAGRIAAIVDSSRRRDISRWTALACCFLALGLVGVLAAQKPQAGEPSTLAEEGLSPELDARLRAFFSAKASQARTLVERPAVVPGVWTYFEAGSAGDWSTVARLWAELEERRYPKSPDDGTELDPQVGEAMEWLNQVWSPLLETRLAWQHFTQWNSRHLLSFGEGIIESIPPGSVYLGGTDAGRGVITALSRSHTDADPFYTLTQSALADQSYLHYLRAMYGQRINLLSNQDHFRCMEDYFVDARRRLNAGDLKPGELVELSPDGVLRVSGQIAVMTINGLLAKVIFDRNPDREFFLEESIPIDWMYPHLVPHKLILRVNREPLPELSESVLQQDREYWRNLIRPMIGDWLNEKTPVREVTTFATRIFRDHDLRQFRGDPQFVQDRAVRAAFAKLRSAIGGVYAWRSEHAVTDTEKDRMARAADFAFRQAFALCPDSSDAVLRYAKLLEARGQLSDAILIAETAVSLDPDNEEFRALTASLREQGRSTPQLPKDRRILQDPPR